jgi:hypothetical protein
MTIHIAVMDYCSGSIKMYSPELRDEIQDEDVENWLCENTDYKDNQCYYMFSKNEIEVEYL